MDGITGTGATSIGGGTARRRGRASRNKASLRASPSTGRAMRAGGIRAAMGVKGAGRAISAAAGGERRAIAPLPSARSEGGGPRRGGASPTRGPSPTTRVPGGIPLIKGEAITVGVGSSRSTGGALAALITTVIAARVARATRIPFITRPFAGRGPRPRTPTRPQVLAVVTPGATRAVLTPRTARTYRGSAKGGRRQTDAGPGGEGTTPAAAPGETGRPSAALVSRIRSAIGASPIKALAPFIKGGGSPSRFRGRGPLIIAKAWRGSGITTS